MKTMSNNNYVEEKERKIFFHFLKRAIIFLFTEN